ncbi:MAG: phosphoglycerate dehydrogenase [Planctomycetota bacterium]
MYRVLISDPLPPDARQILLAEPGLEVVEQSERLEEVVPSIHGWIVRSGTQVTADLLERATKLRCVCRAGAGVDNVDLQAATKHGVVVMNTPGSNARAAAELTVALMMSLARHIPFAHAQLSNGKWNRKDFTGTEVKGKTVGIVGMGRVGAHVARMARGLDMNVIAVDPFLSPDAAKQLGAEPRTFEDMLPDADFITLHTPLTDGTRGLMGEANLARCKRGVRIVNCSRGEVVDESGLLAALASGQVGGAALDVFAQEPLPASSPYLGHPRIIVTPHLGASTVEAQEQVATASARQVAAYLLHGTVENAVNAASLAGDDATRYSPIAQLARQLGWLLAHTLDEAPRSLTVELEDQDNIALLQRLVTDHALAGFLQPSAEVLVNTVNARLIARERGLDIVFRCRTRQTDWIRWVGLEVQGASGSRRLEGAVVGRNSLRLVRLDEYLLDASLEGPLLLTRSDDRPGMMGRVGGVLGGLGLNIANLSLGRDRAGGSALSVFQLDDAPSAAALQRIQQEEGVTWARAVPSPPS